jgi:cystathionine beta-lyase
MHVAEMDFEVAPGIRETLLKLVTESDLGYLGPIPEVGEAFSKYAAKRWQWHVDPNQIKLATDVGVAAVEIFRALVKPGDKVMVNSPVYTNFWTWIPEVHAEIVDVALDRARGWRLDLEAIDNAFASGVKVLLLCNPQNPTGTVHTRAELTALAASARKHATPWSRTGPPSSPTSLPSRPTATRAAPTWPGCWARSRPTPRDAMVR